MDTTPRTGTQAGEHTAAVPPATAGKVDELRLDDGQTTAEYALVLLGVAAIAAVLIKWATSASGLTRLFTAVLRKLVQGVAG